MVLTGIKMKNKGIFVELKTNSVATEFPDRRVTKGRDEVFNNFADNFI